MKKLFALLLALSMVLSMAACGNTADNAAGNDQSGNTTTGDTTTPGDTTEPATQPDPEPVVDNTLVEYYFQKANEVEVTDTQVIFTDDGSGQQVALDKDPQNVAILYGSLICLWHEAGGTVPLVVGGKSAVTLYEEQIGRDITQDEGVKVVTESSSGTSWDVEAILAEKPDLIVTSVGMKGYATISEPAAAVGIPVIGIDYDGVQDYLKWFKVFCNLDGHPELWDEIAEKTANGIIDVVSRVPKDGEAPTGVVLVVSSDTLKAYTCANQSGKMLTELGGVNLVDPDGDAEKSSMEISLEDLYAMDPDFLFLNWYGEEGEMYEQLMGMVQDNPVWNELSAVKNDQFYLLDKSLFHNKANKRYSEAYETMAAFLYPDVFSAQ